MGLTEKQGLRREVQGRISGETPNNHAYVHWETVHLLAKAVDAAGSADRAKVRDALSKIKYDSAVGEVTFDDHNQARLPMILLQIENGKPSYQGRLRGRDPVSRRNKDCTRE